MTFDRARYEVVVVGGGQAGLSMSWFLSKLGIGHVVIEAKRVAEEWREHRWDSFCLVTPNWQCRLPGFSYQGDEPDGFMNREQIIGYLDAYRRLLRPPVVEGVRVERMWVGLDGDFQIRTNAGQIRAGQVVVATGPYHRPVIPPSGQDLPPGWVSIHSREYKRPSQLPAGEVLVVGSGQSGCQIAEDLHLAGRRVHLSLGSAPRVARRYRGRDVVAWLEDMGHYRIPVENHPLGEAVRRNVNHYVTGRDGGHDIDLRAFAREGMEIYGRLLGADAGRLRFADDVAERLDHADSVSESIKDSIDAFIDRSGIDAPHEGRYVPLWQPVAGPRSIELARSNITAVVWATGFRSDFGWVDVPVFDPRGRPRHQRGVSPLKGLYFLGLPWLHTWGSARFSGVAADAEYLGGVIAERAASSRSELQRSA